MDCGRARRDVELLGDRRVREPLRDQRSHLLLPGSEVAVVLGRDPSGASEEGVDVVAAIPRPPVEEVASVRGSLNGFGAIAEGEAAPSRAEQRRREQRHGQLGLGKVEH